VVFAHVYPMAAARAGWRLGAYPMQHVFGTAHLDELADVVDLPVRSSRRMRVGDLRQQLRVLWTRVVRGRSVVCFAGEDSVVSLLLVLRRLRLAPPVVVVAHEQPGRISRLGIRAADSVISLSRLLARQLVDDAGVDPSRVVVEGWGPDLSFRGYVSRGSEFVLSVGKTARDRTTLLQALVASRLPARVYTDDPDDAALAAGALGIEVRPATTAPAATLSYEHVLDDLQRAAVFAVPLRDPRRTVGLTELDDALALGKPIVMTRNPYIDCDIEEVGCGVWVEEGDVGGWVDALERLMGSPELRAEMGERGRRFAEESWNASRFEQAVTRAISAALART